MNNLCWKNCSSTLSAIFWIMIRVVFVCSWDLFQKSILDVLAILQWFNLKVVTCIFAKTWYFHLWKTLMSARVCHKNIIVYGKRCIRGQTLNNYRNLKSNTKICHNKISVKVFTVKSLLDFVLSCCFFIQMQDIKNIFYGKSTMRIEPLKWKMKNIHNFNTIETDCAVSLTDPSTLSDA